MRCPSCYSEESRVVDSRLSGNGDSVRRRRACSDCHHRFTTFERVFLDKPRVLKSDGRREAWSNEKLRRGMLRALEKRPVGLDQLESLVGNISKKIRLAGEREVTSKQIGKEVMDGLRDLDEVAYIRYASVYLSFQDVAEFGKEVDRFQAVQDTEEDSKQLSLLNFIRRTRSIKK